MHSRIYLFVALLAFAISARANDSWQQLFNGQNLTGWDTYLSKPQKDWDVPGLKRDDAGDYLEPIGINHDPLKVFTVTNVDNEPAIHVSGQGFGTLTTTASYTNYDLRLQVKWGEVRWGSRAKARRDCGLLYHVHGEQGFDHGNWPRSFEFQIQERDFGDLYAVDTEITVPARLEPGTNRTPVYIYDPAGQPTQFLLKKPVGNRCRHLVDAEKPRGEWNTLELICFNGNSIHVVNGKVVMRLYHAQRLDGPVPAPITSGKISLQSEGAEVYYRHVEIHPIQAIPAEFAGP